MENLSLSPEIVRLIKAVRFAFVAVVLSVAYFAACSSLNIGTCEQVFRDMLVGKPLPEITTFVFDVRYILIITSLLVPLLAIGTLFSQRLAASFYLLGVLSLVATGQFILIYQGLSAPFFQIIATMQGG